MKKIVFLFMVMCMVFSLFMTTIAVAADFVIGAEKPEICDSKIVLRRGDSIELMLNSIENVVWKSSDTTKAVVDSRGKVTGIGAGSVKITATTSSGSAEVEMFVWNAYLKGGKYYTYKDSARKSKSDILYSKVYLALEKTNNSVTFKVTDRLNKTGTYKGTLIGKYLTSYYDSKNDKSTISYYEYAMGKVDVPVTEKKMEIKHGIITKLKDNQKRIMEIKDYTGTNQEISYTKNVNVTLLTQGDFIEYALEDGMVTYIAKLVNYEEFCSYMMRNFNNQIIHDGVISSLSKVSKEKVDKCASAFGVERIYGDKEWNEYITEFRQEYYEVDQYRLNEGEYAIPYWTDGGEVPEHAVVKNDVLIYELSKDNYRKITLNELYGERENNRELYAIFYTENDSKNVSMVIAISLKNNDQHDTYGLIWQRDGNKFTVTINIGDVNLDGAINLFDLASLKRYLDGTENLTEIQKKIADVNLDGKVNEKDIEKIIEMRL